MRDIWLISLIFLACVVTAFCQENKTGNWINYFGNQGLGKRFNLHNEIQYRNYNFAGDLQQLLLRGGIGYNLTENNNNILLGYGFIRSGNYDANSDNKSYNNEHRIFQQYITKQNFGRVFLLHRYRFEQRFIEKDFSLRYRYQLSVQIPVNKPTIEKNALYLSVYNELFINHSGNRFDRNRIYGAVGFAPFDKIRLEVGYMSQLLSESKRDQLQIAIFNSLPFFS